MSLVVVLGIVVGVMVRGGNPPLGRAIVCIVFGFLLAATALAPQIQDMLHNLPGVL